MASSGVCVCVVLMEMLHRPAHAERNSQLTAATCILACIIKINERVVRRTLVRLFTGRVLVQLHRWKNIGWLGFSIFCGVAANKTGHSQWATHLIRQICHVYASFRRNTDSDVPQHKLASASALHFKRGYSARSNSGETGYAVICGKMDWCARMRRKVANRHGGRSDNRAFIQSVIRLFSFYAVLSHLTTGLLKSHKSALRIHLI